MRVGWTGHRADLFRDPAAARAALDGVAESLDATRYVVGGQRGVDTWAAEAALRFGVPLTVILPAPVAGFVDSDWTSEDRDTLELVLARADDVQIADGYSARNRLVATSVDLLVAVWTGTRGGGTEETIAFARLAGTTVHERRLEPSGTADRAVGRGI